MISSWLLSGCHGSLLAQDLWFLDNEQINGIRDRMLLAKSHVMTENTYKYALSD
jgi:hypothetical protein